MKKMMLAAAAAIVIAATPAFAETNGVVSQSNSVGSIDVTTSIPKMVRITGLSDVNLTLSATDLTNEGGRQNATKRFCVYSNDTTDGLYKLTVDGLSGDELNTGESKFALTGATGNKLSFAVWASDNANNVFGRGTATPGVSRSFQTTAGGQARPTSTTCGGTTNAAINLGISNTRILAALAGTYTGTLTLTVSTI